MNSRHHSVREVMDLPSIIEEFKDRISQVRGTNVAVEYENLNTSKIREFINRMEEDVVYIIDDPTTYSKIIEKIDEHFIPYLFHLDEIYFCPLDSKHVPKHQLVEDPSILGKYLSREFPRILFGDPVVKWNGWRCGSYIRIEREHDEVFYRYLCCRRHLNEEE